MQKSELKSKIAKLKEKYKQDPSQKLKVEIDDLEEELWLLEQEDVQKNTNKRRQKP